MPLESWECCFQQISTFLEYVPTYNLIRNTYFVSGIMKEKECHPRFELSQTFVSLTEFIANNIKICISKEVSRENIFDYPSIILIMHHKYYYFFYI